MCSWQLSAARSPISPDRPHLPIPKRGYIRNQRNHRRQVPSEEDGSPRKQRGARNFSPVLVSAFSYVVWGILVSQFPQSPRNLPIPYSGYISETNETTAAKRSRKQTEAHGSRRKLEILPPRPGFRVFRFFRTFLFPIFKNHPPNLPIFYSEYNSGSNETDAAAAADGCPRKLAILAPAMVSAFSGVFHTFWSPIFQNHPPNLPISYSGH